MCWPKTLSKSSKGKGKANIDGGPPPPPPPPMKKEKHSTSYPPMSPPKSNIFPQTNGAWSRQPRTTEDVHRRPKSSSTNLGSHHQKSWAKALERLNRNNNVGVAPPPLTKKEKEQGSFTNLGSHHRKLLAKALERIKRNNNVRFNEEMFGVALPPHTKKEKEQRRNARKFAPGEFEGVHIYGAFAETSTKPP